MLERDLVRQPLAHEEQPLLVRRGALLVVDLGVHALDRVRALDLQGDRLARHLVHEDLHATAQAEHQVERRLLLDVVVRKRAATVLQLLAREAQPLLIRQGALLVVDLGVHVLDGVGAVDLQRDRLAYPHVREDLHTTVQAKRQEKRRLMLERAVVLVVDLVRQPLVHEKQPPLVRQDVLDALLVLDLVREDPYAATQAKRQEERRLLLERDLVPQPLAHEAQPLLVRGDALLVVGLGVHVLDRVGAVDLQPGFLARHLVREDLPVAAVVTKNAQAI